jgi:hypothetical protein
MSANGKRSEDVSNSGSNWSIRLDLRLTISRISGYSWISAKKDGRQSETPAFRGEDSQPLTKTRIIGAHEQDQPDID